MLVHKKSLTKSIEEPLRFRTFVTSKKTTCTLLLSFHQPSFWWCHILFTVTYVTTFFRIKMMTSWQGRFLLFLTVRTTVVYVVEFFVWKTNAVRGFCTVRPLGDVSADISCGLAVVVRITRFTQCMKEWHRIKKVRIVIVSPCANLDREFGINWFGPSTHSPHFKILKYIIRIVNHVCLCYVKYRISPDFPFFSNQALE